MELRQLGASQVRVSPVTLGTWAVGGWMWGGVDNAQAVRAIQTSIDLGVTSIDTAPIYGFGLSEELVGQAVRGRRDKVQLLTKCGLRWDSPRGEYFFETVDPEGKTLKVYRNSRKSDVLRECEQSLRRLGADCIDLYQVHWRDHTTDIEETMSAMDRLIREGKIRAAGLSNFTAEEVEAASKLIPIASVQPPYSMLRRDIEKDLLPYCREHHVGVLAYSPLQLGILTGKIALDQQFPPSDLRGSSPYYQVANRRRILDMLDQFRPIAEEHDATLAQLVIAWTISQPGVTAALVGARKDEHARENARAADIRISPAQMQQINALLDELKLEL
jgi:aryl-alcohol dehydrogenase-like predicted oxidoreductase